MAFRVVVSAVQGLVEYDLTTTLYPPIDLVEGKTSVNLVEGNERHEELDEKPVVQNLVDNDERPIDLVESGRIINIVSEK